MCTASRSDCVQRVTSARYAARDGAGAVSLYVSPDRSRAPLQNPPLDLVPSTRSRPNLTGALHCHALPSSCLTERAAAVVLLSMRESKSRISR